MAEAWAMGKYVVGVFRSTKSSGVYVHVYHDGTRVAHALESQDFGSVEDVLRYSRAKGFMMTRYVVRWSDIFEEEHEESTIRYALVEDLVKEASTFGTFISVYESVDGRDTLLEQFEVPENM